MIEHHHPEPYPEPWHDPRPTRRHDEIEPDDDDALPGAWAVIGAALLTVVGVALLVCLLLFLTR